VHTSLAICQGYEGYNRAFPYLNEDFSITKNTVIAEGINVQFRGELFNAFNRHIFSSPYDGDPYDTSSFGVVNSLQNANRVGFMHGRIASPGCMQVPLGADLSSRPRQAHGVINYLDHFKELWTQAMLGFLRTASPGDVLIFAPELLSGAHYYARKFPDASGELAEESDRYAEALLYKDLARACFAEAGRRVSGSATK